MQRILYSRYSETEDDQNKNSQQIKGGKRVGRVRPNATKCDTIDGTGGEPGEEEEYLGPDDSVQTYCTEGTPNNFSTATSITDLKEAVAGVARLGTQREEDEEVRNCF